MTGSTVLKCFLMSKEEEATTQQFCLFVLKSRSQGQAGINRLITNNYYKFISKSRTGKFTLHNTCLCMQQMVQYACKCVSMDMHM